MMWKKISIFFFVIQFLYVISIYTQHRVKDKIVISSNNRFLQSDKGIPFFWLGDTGWLLFQKLNRAETRLYLEDRSKKEFNVIQCMVIHTLSDVNRYGDSAFYRSNELFPFSTPGKDTNDVYQYDYWDHVEWVIDEAAKHGLYIALVPIWGSIVKQNDFSIAIAENYTNFLVNRFKDKSNIFWVVGGDIQGNIKREFWEAMGKTIRKNDPNHLITFHPFGRTQSSTWFHNSTWLDFNMFQSGHRRYDQDDSPKKFGEDNWKYILDDYSKSPSKPTLDGEPSYENIPQGLHDTTQPYWNSNDVRRYAYWSVFAGACGHTYGNNSVMQMYRPEDRKPSYGARKYWYESIQDTGSTQMKYLKHLMLSRPYYEKRFDDSLVLNNSGKGYDFIVALNGKSYAMAYIYLGKPINVQMKRISGKQIKAWWFNPRNGEAQYIGLFKNENVQTFTPPGKLEIGNDWVLVLDDSDKNFIPPGIPENYN